MATQDDLIPVIFLLDENGEATGEVYPFCCEHCREDWIGDWNEKPAESLYKLAMDDPDNQTEGNVCCECLGRLKIVRRTHYNNGDEIDLSSGCDGCRPCMINGVLCHETGCPDAWRDYKVECFECGFEFYRGSSRQSVCDDCLNPVEDGEEQGVEDDQDFV